MTLLRTLLVGWISVVATNANAQSLSLRGASRRSGQDAAAVLPKGSDTPALQETSSTSVVDKEESRRLGSPSWCADIPQSVRHWTPECNYGPPDGTPPALPEGMPHWCSDIPRSSWRWVPECTYGQMPSVLPEGMPHWCTYVPLPAWQYTPECSQPSSGPASNASQTQGNGSASGGHGSPSWCADIPQSSRHWVPECTYGQLPSVLPVGMAHWCVYVPLPAWQYTPECRLWSSHQLLGASSNASQTQQNASALKSTLGSSGSPHWCVYVPQSSWHWVPACNYGAPDGAPPALPEGMAEWCIHVPAPAWHYTPECRPRLSAAASNASQTQGNGSASGGRNGSASGGHGSPAWCADIPQSSWHWVPECNDGPPDGMPPAPPAGMPRWCMDIPQSSRHWVPECTAGQLPSTLPAGMADWCVNVPIPAWQYTPECRLWSSHLFFNASQTLRDGAALGAPGFSSWCMDNLPMLAEWVCLTLYPVLGAVSNASGVATELTIEGHA
jgi:hypothetical protein